MDPVRLALVGGFLGSGKTTTLIRLARMLQQRGVSAAIITNDQAAGMVDTRRVEAAGVPCAEIAGGCFCCKFDSLVDAAQRLIVSCAPQIILAEPVGSCTDVRATVAYPMHQRCGATFQLAPLVVMVDPLRASQDVDGTTPFAPDVAYIFERQMEEADVLVLSKADLLVPAEAERLRSALAARHPHARVMTASNITGDGADELLEIITGRSLGLSHFMDVDYDRYAAGEARLGWLNASAVATPMEGDAALDNDVLARELCRSIQRELRDHRAEVAHLKVSLVTEHGVTAASVTGSAGAPAMTERAVAPCASADVTINVRAEAEPAVLERSVRRSCDTVRAARLQLGPLDAFQPGRPRPTHRVVRTARPA